MTDKNKAKLELIQQLFESDDPAMMQVMGNIVGNQNTVLAQALMQQSGEMMKRYETMMDKVMAFTTHTLDRQLAAFSPQAASTHDRFSRVRPARAVPPVRAEKPSSSADAGEPDFIVLDEDVTKPREEDEGEESRVLVDLDPFGIAEAGRNQGAGFIPPK